MKRNNHFDEQIKKALESYQSKIDSTAGWERLNKSLQQDAQFDQQIQSVLKDARFHSKYSVWEAFENRRKAQRDLRNKMIMTRTAEAVILLLLLWTINQIVIPEMILKDNSIFASLLHRKMEKKADNFLVSRTSINRTMTEKETEKVESIASIHLPQVELNFRLPKKLSGNKTSSVRSQATENKNKIKPTAILSKNQDNTLGNNDQNFGDKGSEITDQTVISDLKLKFYDSLQTLVSTEEIEKANLLIVITQTPPDFREQHFVFKKLKKKYPNPLSLSLLYGPKFTKVSSLSKDPNFINRTEVNSELKLNLIFDHDPYRLVTGLLYCNYNSHPNISEEYVKLNKYLWKKSVTQANHQLLSIPVGLEKKMLRYQKLSLYAGAGMSLCLNLKNEYDFRNEKIGNIFIPPGSLEKYKLYSNLEDPNYNLGLIEGGSASENSFVEFFTYAQLNYRFSNHWDALFRAEYNNMLGSQSLSTDSEKLKSWFVGTGMSVRI